MNYLEFDFEITDTQHAETLIALLSDQNFEGFEETEKNLKAFIKEADFNDVIFKETLLLFPSIKYTTAVIENINWNQQWEDNFEPVLVDDFVAVRAHFHQSIKTVQHEIIITPKMSFGTGHHATTHLMMQLMRAVDFKNKTVFDFGTGTGVLAILAEILGAVNIRAIDIDEWSIINTQENIIKNNCNQITVEQMDRIPSGNQYDIILANINLNVITETATEIACISKPGAIVLFSGFLKTDEKAMTETLLRAGFSKIEIVQRGDWIAIACLKE